MNQWWGPAVTNVHRTALVYDDLKDWAIRREDGTCEVRWFIANKQVCRNFWLRARGQHHETIRKLENQFLKETRTFSSAALDVYIQKDGKPCPK